MPNVRWEKRINNNITMKKLIIIICLFITAIQAQAQCAIENTAFKSGESLTYDLEFNWKFIWYKVGTASMNTIGSVYNGAEVFRTKLISKTSHKADFFFIMRDTLTSIYTKELIPLYFRKGAEEGKRYTIDEAWFSYQGGKSIINQRRTYRDGSVSITKQIYDDCVYDMLSILARARSFDSSDLNKLQKIHFPMTTGKNIEEQTLLYRGKKNFTSNDKRTYRCLVFSLVEYEKNKEKEIITFYITDDKNHLPVRLDMYLRFGSAKAFLTSIRGNRYPLSSIISGK